MFKKIICGLFVTIVFITSIVTAGLSDHERDVLFRKAEWAAVKAQQSYNQGEQQIRNFRDEAVKTLLYNAVVASSIGYKGGLTGVGIAFVVTNILNIARNHEEYSNEINQIYNSFMDAKHYILISEECQEHLWLDR